MKLSIDRYLGRYPTLSTFIYLAIVMGLCLSALFCLLDALEIYRARERSSEKLARIKERTELATSRHEVTADSWPVGSPFLEGQTVTIAGASLLQRITESVVRAGGSVDSSEITTQESQLKNGYLKGMAIFEIEQTALQIFLYDIEGGMPFLFVDELVVNAPSSNTAGKTRVTVQVSGRWWGAK
jgi:general secretion pathway protein M